MKFVAKNNMGFSIGDDVKSCTWNGGKYVANFGGEIHPKEGDILDIEFTGKPWDKLTYESMGFTLKEERNATINRDLS
jgi:hypothetical protein